MARVGTAYRFDPRQLTATQRLRSAPLTAPEAAALDARLNACPHDPAYAISPHDLREALAQVAWTPREQHTWVMRATRMAEEKPLLIYIRMLCGLRAVHTSPLPAELHFPLLAGLADCGNPYLTSYGLLPEGLRTLALFQDALSPAAQVDVLLASAAAMGTRVDDAWAAQGWLFSSLSITISALQDAGLHGDLLADTITCLARHTGLELPVSLGLADTIAAFTSRGWNTAQALRAIRLILIYSGDYQAWIERHLHPTLNILHATGCTPEQQYILLEHIARSAPEMRVTLSDGGRGIWTFDDHDFDPHVLAQAWLVATALEAEIAARDEDRRQRHAAQRQQHGPFAGFEERLAEIMTDTFQFAGRKDRFSLCLALIDRAKDALRFVLDLMLSLHTEVAACPLLDVYCMLCTILPYLTDRERLHVMQHLTSHDTLVASHTAEFAALFEQFAAKKSEFLRAILQHLAQATDRRRLSPRASSTTPPDPAPPPLALAPHPESRLDDETPPD